MESAVFAAASAKAALDFPESIRSCHSATQGMLLVVPCALKRNILDSFFFFFFFLLPGFHQSLPWKVFSIIWILGLS